jgi:hypothetical protein
MTEPYGADSDGLGAPQAVVVSWDSRPMNPPNGCVIYVTDVGILLSHADGRWLDEVGREWPRRD